MPYKPKTYVLCEAHDDKWTRQAILENLDTLRSRGYETFALEHSQGRSLADEIEDLKGELQDAYDVYGENILYEVEKLNSLLKKLFTVKEHFNEVLEHRDRVLPILGYESSKTLLEIFNKIKETKMHYQGLDIDLGNRYKLTIKNMCELLDKIPERDEVIAKNLLTIKNGIALIGLLHLPGVIENLCDEIGETAAKEQYCFVVPAHLFSHPYGLNLAPDVLEYIRLMQNTRGTHFKNIYMINDADQLLKLIDVANNHSVGQEVPVEFNVERYIPEEKRNCCSNPFRFFQRMFTPTPQLASTTTSSLKLSKQKEE